MSGEIANQVVTIVVTAIVSGAVGLVAGFCTSLGKFMKALRIGLRTLLRVELVDAYQKYFIERNKMSLERCQELWDCYEAYRLTGGNGLIKKKIWPDLVTVMPFIVGAKPRRKRQED